MVNELIVQQDGRVVFSRSILSNAGNMVAVLGNVTHLWMHSILPSGSLVLPSRVSGITLHENCGRKCAGLVTL